MTRLDSHKQATNSKKIRFRERITWLESAYGEKKNKSDERYIKEDGFDALREVTII